MTELELRMVDAVKRCVAKGWAPRGFWLQPSDYHQLKRMKVGDLPVRVTHAKDGKSKLYATCGRGLKI